MGGKGMKGPMIFNLLVSIGLIFLAMESSGAIKIAFCTLSIFGFISVWLMVFMK